MPVSVLPQTVRIAQAQALASAGSSTADNMNATAQAVAQAVAQALGAASASAQAAMAPPPPLPQTEQAAQGPSVAAADGPQLSAPLGSGDNLLEYQVRRRMPLRSAMIVRGVRALLNHWYGSPIPARVSVSLRS